jgi:DNA-binding GntR family transcriptional regulator
MFEKIVQQTTPNSVLEVLRKLIFNGFYSPGSQLREIQIAEELGISRAPLREALGRLEEEGLIVRVPYKGAFVAEISSEAVEEINIVRELVEAHVIEKALPVLLSSEVANLDRIVADMKSAAKKEDFQKALDAHLELHRLIYECANNEVLMSMWKSWESQLRLYFADDLRTLFDPPTSAASHAELVAIIKTGDIDKIKAAVVGHVHKNGD